MLEGHRVHTVCAKSRVDVRITGPHRVPYQSSHFRIKNTNRTTIGCFLRLLHAVGVAYGYKQCSHLARNDGRGGFVILQCAPSNQAAGSATCRPHRATPQREHGVAALGVHKLGVVCEDGKTRTRHLPPAAAFSVACIG